MSQLAMYSKILVVDDESEVRALLKEFLEGENYQVEIAEETLSSETGRGAFRTHPRPQDNDARFAQVGRGLRLRRADRSPGPVHTTAISAAKVRPVQWECH